MEITNIDELKNLIREIVREELGIGKTSESIDQPTTTAKTDNSHEVNKIREQIKAIPSTPLSPGVNPNTDSQSNSSIAQSTVVDMEI